MRWFALNENRYKSEVKFMPNAYQFKLTQALNYIHKIVDKRINMLRGLKTLENDTDVHKMLMSMLTADLGSLKSLSEDDPNKIWKHKFAILKKH